jgi:hypothetical protein
MNENDDSKPQRKTVGRPFEPGDARINRTGRPKTFEELRRTADMIASELVPGPNGEMIPRGELLLRSWIKSKNPILQRSFIEYWVGKVPDKLETNALQPGTVLRLHFAHERPDLLEPSERRRLEEQQRRLKGLEAPSDISENS